MKIIFLQTSAVKNERKLKKLGIVQHRGLEIVKALWFQ